MQKIFLSSTVLLAASVLISCSSETKPDIDILTEGKVDVSYPEQVQSFNLASTLNDPDPVIGLKLDYASADFPELVLTVYIYFRGFFETEASAIEYQSKQFLEEVNAASEQGIYKLLEHIQEQTQVVTAGDKSYQGHRHLLSLEQNYGAETLSIADIFFKPPYFVKIRGTFPEGGNTSFDDAITAFSSELLAQVAIGEKIRCDNTLRVTSMSADTDWVSIEGRAMASDGSPINEDNVKENPMYIAMLKRAARAEGCPKQE